jgi:aspartyl-tRNA(Asn)/glutamyl-tRNA(Gln) amidotransferase subunit B
MYKVVIGLEVHCELNTKSKNFSSAKNEYCSYPNTNVQTVDLGLPGILPVVNKEAVRKALKVALALNCETPKYLRFARKNYFYPDLPKGYQITQHQNQDPIGKNGYLMINVAGVDKKVLIHDTHLEEDTASLDHFGDFSLIDYNRCGVPLLETVTEPCLNSADEAITFLESLRSLFLYCDASEARSDRGQIRCDVNVSLMKENDTELGTKVEMKNINSFNNVRLAIECEIKRQTELLDKGEPIIQETRRFSEEDNKTYSMREKVDAIDYKYFTEPNIPPIEITSDFLEETKQQIPELAFSRVNRYINDYNLTRRDANILVKELTTANYYEDAIVEGGDPKTVANWIVTNINSYLNEEELTIDKISLTPKQLVSLLDQISSGKISNKQAKEVLQKALSEKKNPLDIIKDLGLSQITDKEEIRKIALEVLEEYSNLIEDYKNGKKVFGFFVGQIMKKSNGRANPVLSNQVLQEELDKK